MSDNKNLELWEKVARVPPDQLKGFKRAGGFTGTAIKPMWSIHKMTEVFGPCGQAWGVGEPVFQTVSGDNKETLVFCTVQIWLDGMGHKLTGVGGDKVVKYIPANPQYNRPERWENDDEAFKKAFTDAVTNALKFMGVGADIHMGLWDGNKYVDEQPEDKPNKSEPAEFAPKAQPYDANPIVRGAYKVLDVRLNQISQSGSLEDLKAFWMDNAETIKGLPAGWRKELEAKKDEIKTALTEKAE